MIIILDFGSQYSQLIARKVRAMGVYSQILPFTTPAAELAALKPSGIILSGGPASVSEEDSPKTGPDLLDVGCPILGICYGMQLLVHLLGGKVAAQAHSEYGRAMLEHIGSDELLTNVPQTSIVWMSHNDAAVRLPDEWQTIATTQSCPQAAVRHATRPLYGLQFHPEVHHTVHGEEILRNFVLTICATAADWKMTDFIEATCAEIRTRLDAAPAGSRIVSAVSGGVDSTVMAALLHRAVGERFVPVFVDNGVLRLNESDIVVANFRDRMGINIKRVEAADHFLDALEGVGDPEQKRKIIGREFVNIFFRDLQPNDFLAQGTLYPDVIESVNVKGPSAVIKTHHNRVQEILDLMEQGRVIEPLRELFKDEVRELGLQLGIPRELLWRHPFPGPGLAVRILGAITRERLDTLRRADAIVIEEMKQSGYYDKTWQTFAVLLPVKAVGVMGDSRTYADVVAIRSVDSVDAMTADFSHLPFELLGRMSTRIINEVPGVNRVVYDISSKPPATIEWE